MLTTACGKNQVGFDSQGKASTLGADCVDDSTGGCDDSDPVLNTNLRKIEYFHGGWFPAPNTPNFRAKLDLEYDGEKQVYFDLETPAGLCAGVLSPSLFQEVAVLIENTATKTDTGPSFIDSGDEYVDLTYLNMRTDLVYGANYFTPPQRKYLKAGDSSTNNEVFINSAEIRKALDHVIGLILKDQKKCK